MSSMESVGVVSQCRISCKPTKYQGPLITGLSPSCSGAWKKNDTTSRNSITMTVSFSGGQMVLLCSRMMITMKIVKVAMWWTYTTCKLSEAPKRETDKNDPTSGIPLMSSSSIRRA